MQDRSHFINDINVSVNSVLLIHFYCLMCCINELFVAVKMRYNLFYLLCHDTSLIFTKTCMFYRSVVKVEQA